MTTVIDMTDGRRLPCGVDFELFDDFVERVACGSNVEADLRARLQGLDVHLKVGDEVARRYWRLLAEQFDRGLTTERFDDACFDRVVTVASLLFHWQARHGTLCSAN
jgi:hypothetical protein